MLRYHVVTVALLTTIQVLPTVATAVTETLPQRSGATDGAAPGPEPPAKSDNSSHKPEGKPDASAAEGEADAAASDDEADAVEAEVQAAEAEANAAEQEAEAAEAEALAAEEAAMEDEERPDRPAPKGKAVIWGIVRGAVDKEPLPEATVTVVGTKLKTVADYEGRFRLELPPGTHTLRFFYELHQPALLKAISVKAQQVAKLDVAIVPDEASVETFEVETQADKSSIEGQVLARQRATSVGDGVGRAEISKTPATNAAQAAQRVVGATVVGGRFIYVRGLGERYTNSLLNGAPLPSPEPDRAAIPLDLFPSLILDNITITKTFTPDLPADFAGGSVNIQTRELPSKPLYQASIRLGYDDQSTFRARYAQRGSSTDFLGFDSGLRALPSALRNTPYNDLSQDQQLQAARDVNSYMSPQRAFTPPQYALSGVIGNGWDLGKERRLGALLTLNYGRSYTLRDDMVLRTFRLSDTDGTTAPRPANDYKGEFGSDRVNWGALGSVSYWPNRKHRVTLTGLRTQISDSSVQVVQGFNESLGGDVGSTRLTYVSRVLNMAQLRGEHDFPSVSNAKLDWNGTLAYAARYEPNTRDTVFNAGEGRPYYPVNTPESGSHLYADQGEFTKGAGFNWSQPFSKVAEASSMKVGALVSAKSRNFSARRYHLSETQGSVACGQAYSPACADPIYTDENILAGRLGMQEDTRQGDAYKAGLNVYGTYAMTDISLTNNLRMVGGARVEVTRQDITPVSQFPGIPALAGGHVNSTDVLPSVGLIYSATKKAKVRFSVSRTLARPQIRELSPFVFTDYFGGRAYSGNPDLKMTYINSGDLRFEYFATLSEIMAFSFFFKDFENPIENVILDSGSDGTIMPRNTPGAKLLGVELEARKSLGFVDSVMKDLTLIGNLTLSKSTIDLQLGEQVVQLTSRSRPMVNQSPYVINLALDYAGESNGFGARLLYNVSGRRIVEVGARGMPDSYEQSRHVVDLTLSQKVGKNIDIRLTATNLLGSKHVITLGSKHDDGLVQRSYREPRVISLAGTYTY